MSAYELHTATVPPETEAVSPSKLSGVLRTMRQAPLLPVAIVLLFIIVGVLAPYISPHSPTQANLAQSLRPPAWQEGGSIEYPLGTDKLGRDILSRIIYGARVSLLVAVASIGAAGLIGALLGMLAGFRRGWTETMVMRLVDVNLSLPTILLALLVAVISGPSLRNLLIVISLSLWSYYARQTHAETLSLREREFVAAARSIGATDARLLLRYILPNLFNSIVILATLQISTVVLMEAALSFLGVGIPPPTPSWGLMISDGRSMLQSAWWVSTIPGIALAAIIVSANLLGDWLRDYLDPTLRRSR